MKSIEFNTMRQKASTRVIKETIATKVTKRTKTPKITNFPNLINESEYNEI